MREPVLPDNRPEGKGYLPCFSLHEMIKGLTYSSTRCIMLSKRQIHSGYEV